MDYQLLKSTNLSTHAELTWPSVWQYERSTKENVHWCLKTGPNKHRRHYQNYRGPFSRRVPQNGNLKWIFRRHTILRTWVQSIQGFNESVVIGRISILQQRKLSKRLSKQTEPAYIQTKNNILIQQPIENNLNINYNVTSAKVFKIWSGDV